MISLLDFLKFSPEERLPFFSKAGQLSDLSANLIEKDFWVSFVLDLVFKLPKIGEVLTFKGGTSLSKVYNLIRRFSEDIDLTIEKAHLGFEEENLRESAVSNKKREQQLTQLSLACRTYVQGEIFQALEADLSKVLANKAEWKLSLDTNDVDGQTINFAYPAIANASSNYIAPIVKIEFGSRGEVWPTEEQEFTSYMHSALKNELEEWYIPVKALKPTRTFWEKATILHNYANYPEGKIVPERQSRHYYDFYCLINSKVKDDAVKDIKLLTDVCDHKAIYFRSAAAKYEEAKSGNLKLVPQGEVARQLEADYLKMSEMLLDEPVEWNIIVSTLKQFETDLK